MVFKWAAVLIGLSILGAANAQRLLIPEVTAPADLKNIHVVKIASDPHSSDFVIFVKHQVPLHKHESHSESLYVLEGAGQFQLGEETFNISPGDYIKIPEGMPHSVKVSSPEPLKVISIQAPEFFGKDRIAVK